MKILHCLDGNLKKAKWRDVVDKKCRNTWSFNAKRKSCTDINAIRDCRNQLMLCRQGLVTRCKSNKK
jgi:hypothetical protein